MRNPHVCAIGAKARYELTRLVADFEFDVAVHRADLTVHASPCFQGSEITRHIRPSHRKNQTRRPARADSATMTLISGIHSSLL